MENPTWSRDGIESEQCHQYIDDIYLLTSCKRTDDGVWASRERGGFNPMAGFRAGAMPVADAIARAWSEALPSARFDLDVSWEDSGADSLKSMMFVMRLEELLDRTVPLDLLTGDVTPRQLALRLSADYSDVTTPETPPRMFLFPGVFGDVPQLARLRAAFADVLTLNLIDLPGLDYPVSLLADLPATVRLLTDRIAACVVPGEPISLFGWSFGGVAAFEVAHRLRADGYTVDLLCVLDSMAGAAPPATPSPSGAKPRRSAITRGRALLSLGRRMAPLLRKARLSRLPSYASRLLFAGLVHTDRLERARQLNRRLPPPPHRTYAQHKAIIGPARKRAAEAWMPKPLPVPTLLIATEDGRKVDLESTWRRLCPNIEVVDVPFTHENALLADAMAAYRPAIVDAVRRVRDGTWR